MVKAVIFDLDGLLVDTEIIAYRIYDEIFREYGLPYTKEYYARQFSGKTMKDNIAYLLETYPVAGTPEEWFDRILRMENEQMVNCGVQLKPGARELLAYLDRSGCPIALATSSLEPRAMGMLREHGVDGYFDAFVFGREVARNKPYPDIFLKACEKLGQRPEDCLVLEDSEAGVQAAAAANIPVICVPDMKRPDERVLTKTAAVLDSLEQVIPYLDGE